MKPTKALTMIGNDIVRFCQLVLQLYVIFTKVVTLKVFQKMSYKSMIAFKLELLSFKLIIYFCTHAIIFLGSYFLNPLFEDHFLCFQGHFVLKILFLCTVSVFFYHE